MVAPFFIMFPVCSHGTNMVQTSPEKQEWAFDGSETQLLRR